MPHANSMFNPIQFMEFKENNRIKIRRTIYYSDITVCVISVKLEHTDNVVALGSIPGDWVGEYPGGKRA